ncbi:TetR/AcrR family transcriptional regulator [Nioella sp. MMSF_3534]|uniref:TetR/AcrR family transcriptional regulator n=1 Tax=Nioella sp. MMSF_3534 TaxID=3046720 RepID=UPI00273D910B|nr:TetR/AcrR family transcriptional regulator [Nioella sp. MMSF_3534]
MRVRKSSKDRVDQILDVALKLFLNHGYAEVQIEHIRAETGLSRGGFYHHFGSKSAVLQALVDREQKALAKAAGPDLCALLTKGSAYLDAPAGVEDSLTAPDDITLYLGYLETAQDRHLAPLIEEALSQSGNLPMPAEHAAQIILSVNHRITRQVLTGHWTQDAAVSFARSALIGCEAMLDKPGLFAPVLTALDGTP